MPPELRHMVGVPPPVFTFTAEENVTVMMMLCPVITFPEAGREATLLTVGGVTMTASVPGSGLRAADILALLLPFLIVPPLRFDPVMASLGVLTAPLDTVAV